MNMIIRPIYPTLPIRPPQISVEMAMLIFNALAFLMLAGAAAFFIGVYTAKRWKADKTKTAVAFVLISVAVTILLLCFFGFAVSTVKGIILCLILLFSSYSDIKTREADDYLHVMILLTAFIGREPTDIPGMLLSAALITLPLIMPVILCKGKVIGGADVNCLCFSTWNQPRNHWSDGWTDNRCPCQPHHTNTKKQSGGFSAYSIFGCRIYGSLFYLKRRVIRI